MQIHEQQSDFQSVCLPTRSRFSSDDLATPNKKHHRLWILCSKSEFPKEWSCRPSQYTLHFLRPRRSQPEPLTLPPEA